MKMKPDEKRYNLLCDGFERAAIETRAGAAEMICAAMVVLMNVLEKVRAGRQRNACAEALRDALENAIAMVERDEGRS